jgi:hypothetical protein
MSVSPTAQQPWQPNQVAELDPQLGDTVWVLVTALRTGFTLLMRTVDGNIF